MDEGRKNGVSLRKVPRAEVLEDLYDARHNPELFWSNDAEPIGDLLERIRVRLEVELIIRDMLGESH